MSDSRYVKDGDSYQWVVNGNIVHQSKSVSICYGLDNNQSAIIYKHGTPEDVELWYKLNAKQFNEIFHENLNVLSSDNWAVDDLNMFINCTGSIYQWLIDNKIHHV